MHKMAFAHVFGPEKKNGFGPFSYKFFVCIRVGLRWPRFSSTSDLDNRLRILPAIGGGQLQSSPPGHRLGPALSTAALGRPNRRPSGGQRSTCTAVFSAVAPVPEVDALRTACRRWIVPVGRRNVRLVGCRGLHTSH